MQVHLLYTDGLSQTHHEHATQSDPAYKHAEQTQGADTMSSVGCMQPVTPET